MLYGLYLSATGLALNEHRQEVIANNLANVDTVAFKRDLAVSTQRRQEADTAPAGSRFLPPYLREATGGAFVSQRYTDFSPGPTKITNRNLDVALNGPGMLTVQDGQRTAYSRDGRLTLANGRLVRETDGKAVLDADGREIVLGDASAHELHIDPQGQIWRRNVQQAQLGIVEFDEPQGLSKLGGNLFQAPGAGRQATRTQVVSEALELSGVNPSQELVEMIQTARNFEINAEMISLQDESLARLINDLSKL
jgi:flagellar basal-body rod protein FlgG